MTEHEIAMGLASQIQCGADAHDVKRGLYQTALGWGGDIGARDLHSYANAVSERIWNRVNNILL